MKKIIYTTVLSASLLFSCAPDLDTYPKDALSPAIFWKNKKEVDLALTACYNNFESGYNILVTDCLSDDAFNYHAHEGWRKIANGTITAADPGINYYSYTTIVRCNEFLKNIDNLSFLDTSTKDVYKSQVRFIRAYRYYLMHINYGAVPLVLDVFDTPESSKVPRNTSDEIYGFIKTELEEIIPLLPASYSSDEYGKITKGAAQTLLMRLYLHRDDFANALSIAKQIEGYELFPSYAGLFEPENEQNKEVILSIQQTEDLYEIDYVPLLPNGVGGWSSAVPTQDLVDAYQMADGRTIDEAKATGDYDEANPYKNRDPRLRATIIYPGQLWQSKAFGSIISGNADYYNKADNASKTGYNYRKYLNRYDNNLSGYWNSGADIFLFRYAEILLTIAEASNEVSGPSAEVYDALNKVRARAGMPNVDTSKYGTKETLREFIRNERRVELAMEGVRRWDILRWKIAPTVLNKKIYGTKKGTILTTQQANGDYDVNLNLEANEIETRQFDESKHYLLPIPQSAIDKNPKLKPNNPGY